MNTEHEESDDTSPPAQVVMPEFVDISSPGKPTRRLKASVVPDGLVWTGQDGATWDARSTLDSGEPDDPPEDE